MYYNLKPYMTIVDRRSVLCTINGESIPPTPPEEIEKRRGKANGGEGGKQQTLTIPT